jgi:membrane fusion protein (multidrug efflux system)
MRVAAWRLALLMAVVQACRPTSTASTSAPASVPVETVAVATEDVDVTVQAVGTLKADQIVDVKPKRSGLINEVRMNEGARVEAGEVLVTLQDADLRAQVEVARASVTDAEVRERNARQQYERNAALLKKGVASQQQYDDAAAELDRAIAARGVAQANLSFAEAQLADTVIRAPFGGILGQRRVDVGAFVKDGETITTLVDADPVEIVFAVPERYVSQLRIQQAARVRLASHGERTFPGTVNFIDPQVDPINRTLAVKAVIPNPDLALRPGEFATVELRLARHANMPVIPEEAVVPDGERTLVFVVDNGSAAARVIRTGVRLPGRVEVVDGLQPGERVVRIGHEKLRTDVAVPVVDVGAPKEG